MGRSFLLAEELGKNRIFFGVAEFSKISDGRQ